MSCFDWVFGKANAFPFSGEGALTMNAAVPTITALYAALLGLLGAALTINVIVNRVRAKVEIADGGVRRSLRRSGRMPTSPSRHRLR